MALIDRIGRYRGVPTQGIMGESSGGFPQFVVTFLATEMYDETTNTWIDWSPYQQTMTAYLILFNASKALLNYEQVMKAFGWDGVNLNALQSDDFGDLVVQFAVKENVYTPPGASVAKISLRIDWIDHVDANPLSGGGGSLTPMDTGKLKTMAAKYGQFMKTAPKIAPVSGGGPPRIGTDGLVAPVSGGALVNPVIPLPKAVVPLPDVPPPVLTGITQQEAWANLNVFNKTLAAELSEDTLGDAFLNASEVVANTVGRSEIEMTETDWAEVLTIATFKLVSA